MKIFLIGPGGTGKSTCGKILASILGYCFFDLDEEFCKKIRNIRSYIRSNGYKKYCLENSRLFHNAIGRLSKNCVISLSSGFLVHEEMKELALRHRQLLKRPGVSILLLPSKSLKKSTEIIVKRQITRGLGLDPEKEKNKFIRRFPVYRRLGDIQIFSCDKPEIIAKRIKKEIKVLDQELKKKH